MFRSLPRLLLFLSSITACCVLPPQATAQMMLTPTAIAEGFGLSTFATGFPTSNNLGPFGIAFSGSKVIVSDIAGNVRLFPMDVDGQSAASAPVAQNYGFGNSIGIANANGRYFMTQDTAASLVEINADGTSKQTILTNISHPNGIVGNTSNGHIFVSTDSGILDVNPDTRTFRVFQSIRADGLTIDSTTLYAEAGGNRIIGYRLSDGAQVFNSGAINDAPDGTALGTGTLAGDIFVNTNGGRLLEFNLTGTPAATVLGVGGSRGDFVTVDPNGTLLLTQTDRILRLTAPAGGGFGNTPEPGTITMLVAGGLTGAAFLRRRKCARRIVPRQ